MDPILTSVASMAGGAVEFSESVCLSLKRIFFVGEEDRDETADSDECRSISGGGTWGLALELRIFEVSSFARSAIRAFSVATCPTRADLEHGPFVARRASSTENPPWTCCGDGVASGKKTSVF